jgi:cytochrome d ubiquinol oxidase subunit I
VAATFVAAVCAWWMVRANGSPDATAMYRPGAILGSLVALVACVGLFFTGDVQGKLMFHQQPMKMAAAESLCHTETDPKLSLLTVGTHNNCDSITRVIEVPYALPFLAEGKFSGVTLQGTKDLQQQYEQKFGPGWYVPNLFVTYWAFRAMIGLMAVPLLFALATLWLTRRGRVPGSRWYSRFALVTIPTPFLAAIAGWVFTEMGRQPWIVFSLMLTEDGVSPNVPGWTVLISLIAFTAVYASLAVVEFGLIRKAAQKGPDPLPEPGSPEAEDPAASHTQTTVY